MTELNPNVTGKLVKFAFDMAGKYPEQASAIINLQNTLEQRLPEETKERITLALNKDADGVLAHARQAAANDPMIFSKIEQDPKLLTQMLGIENPTPAAASTPEALAQRQQELLAEISQANGYDEFIGRLEKHPDLNNTIGSVFNASGDDPAGSVRALEKIKTGIEKNPDFLVDMGGMIDDKKQAFATWARGLMDAPSAAAPAPAAADHGGSGLGGIMGGLGDTFNALTSHLGGILTAVVAVLKDVLGNLPGMLHGLANSLQSWTGGLAQQDHNISNTNGRMSQALAANPPQKAYDASGQEQAGLDNPAAQKPDADQDPQVAANPPVAGAAAPG